MQVYLFFCVCLLLVACGSPRYTFDYATTSSTVSSMTLAPPLKIDMEFEGFTDNVVPSLLFEINFENTGDQIIVTNSSEYYILDDEGVKFQPQNVSPTLSIAPKTSAKLNLIVPLPAKYSLQYVGSFRLFWDVEWNGKTYKHVSKFLRKIVQYKYIEKCTPYDYHWGVHLYSDPFYWRMYHRPYYRHHRHPHRKSKK
ncbi:MAG TPA: hypothetical protein PKM32_07885 [Planctomycetota bacterium]|nr:hypothetical protein [Planctomycetota bacterium]HPY74871.1 hypothetical protein [Planctomycetota bacterium]HQB00897.1 hypothetical protein [Planctomycetota bacterium]